MSVTSSPQGTTALRWIYEINSLRSSLTKIGQESIPNTSERMHECGESSAQLAQLLDDCVSKIKFKPGKLANRHFSLLAIHTATLSASIEQLNIKA